MVERAYVGRSPLAREASLETDIGTPARTGRKPDEAENGDRGTSEDADATINAITGGVSDELC